MYDRLLQPDVRMMLVENDIDGLHEFCEALHPAVVAEVLAGFEADEAWRVLSCCPVERQAEIFPFLGLPQQMALVQVMDRKPLSQLIETMSSDDRVDLLERMDEDHVDALLPLIAQAERSDIRKLLSYPDHSAGSIMTTEYASLPGDLRVAEALQRLRQQAPNRETIYYIFVLDEGRRLHGIVSLRELILAKPQTLIADIMQRDVISVRVEDDQEVVAQQLARYDLIALPVVDNQNRLVGIITHDDILDVVQEEANEDAYRQGAIEPFEDSYLTTPLRTIAWKRGMWLGLLLIAAFLTAHVIDSFEEAPKWMTLFLPMVLASGGNSGSQSATLMIRTMALGELNDRNRFHIARRELLVGATLGSFLMLLGLLAALYFVDLPRAGVVALTLLLVVTVGSVVGAMLPILFKALGMDPALMSNPLIAALSDMIGVVIYFLLAGRMLTALGG